MASYKESTGFAFALSGGAKELTNKWTTLTSGKHFLLLGINVRNPQIMYFIAFSLDVLSPPWLGHFSI